MVIVPSAPLVTVGGTIWVGTTFVLAAAVGAMASTAIAARQIAAERALETVMVNVRVIVDMARRPTSCSGQGNRGRAGCLVVFAALAPWASAFVTALWRGTSDGSSHPRTLLPHSQ